MTSRQILRTAPEDLVPPANTGRFRLPERTQVPKNTLAADSIEKLTGIVREAKTPIAKGVLSEAIRSALKDASVL